MRNRTARRVGNSYTSRPALASRGSGGWRPSRGGWRPSRGGERSCGGDAGGGDVGGPKTLALSSARASDTYCTTT